MTKDEKKQLISAALRRRAVERCIAGVSRRRIAFFEGRPRVASHQVVYKKHKPSVLKKLEPNSGFKVSRTRVELDASYIIGSGDVIARLDAILDAIVAFDVAARERTEQAVAEMKERVRKQVAFLARHVPDGEFYDFLEELETSKVPELLTHHERFALLTRRLNRHGWVLGRLP